MKKLLLSLALGVAAISFGACAHDAHGGKRCPLGMSKKKTDACCTTHAHGQHAKKDKCCSQ